MSHAQQSEKQKYVRDLVRDFLDRELTRDEYNTALRSLVEVDVHTATRAAYCEAAQ